MLRYMHEFQPWFSMLHVMSVFARSHEYSEISVYVTIIGCNAKSNKLHITKSYRLFTCLIILWWLLLPFSFLQLSVAASLYFCFVLWSSKGGFFLFLCYTFSKVGSMQWTVVYLCKRFYLLLLQHGITLLEESQFFFVKWYFGRIIIHTNIKYSKWTFQQISSIFSIEFERIVKFIWPAKGLNISLTPVFKRNMKLTGKNNRIAFCMTIP